MVLRKKDSLLERPNFENEIDFHLPNSSFSILYLRLRMEASLAQTQRITHIVYRYSL